MVRYEADGSRDDALEIAREINQNGAAIEENTGGGPYGADYHMAGLYGGSLVEVIWREAGDTGRIVVNVME